MVWSPLASSIAEGVLPTKLPSISISAPPGVDSTDILGELAFISGATDATAGAAVVACGAQAARSSLPWSVQCLAMASHASGTDPPTESVECLTTVSQLCASNTASLLLCFNLLLPPSCSNSPM